MLVKADVVIVPVGPKNLSVLVDVPSRYVNNTLCPADTFVTLTDNVVTPELTEFVANAHIVVEPDKVATGNSCTVAVTDEDANSLHAPFFTTTL